MEQSVEKIVRMMPRSDLEAFAYRAALQLRASRHEIQAGNMFVAVLAGFLAGVMVTVSGFLAGLGLG